MQRLYYLCILRIPEILDRKTVCNLKFRYVSFYLRLLDVFIFLIAEHHLLSLQAEFHEKDTFYIFNHVDIKIYYHVVENEALGARLVAAKLEPKRLVLKSKLSLNSGWCIPRYLLWFGDLLLVRNVARYVTCRLPFLLIDVV